jgi:hypothetical protein
MSIVPTGEEEAVPFERAPADVQRRILRYIFRIGSWGLVSAAVIASTFGFATERSDDMKHLVRNPWMGLLVSVVLIELCVRALQRRSPGQPTDPVSGEAPSLLTTAKLLALATFFYCAIFLYRYLTNST